MDGFFKGGYFKPTLRGLGAQVDRVLLTFGVASLAGIWITGRIVDHSLRRAVLASLAGFAVISLLSALATLSTAQTINPNTVPLSTRRRCWLLMDVHGTIANSRKNNGAMRR